jgi:protein expanded
LRAETANGSANSSIDINTLREKSKNLDLPLISALMHDSSLLKQTRAFVMPKHPRSMAASLTSMTTTTTTTDQPVMVNMPKIKYPVSGLSTTQLAKPRKTSISHRHPNDKLPPLPCQTTEGNQYVMDCSRCTPRSTESR